jgi:hypothetical protein
MLILAIKKNEKQETNRNFKYQVFRYSVDKQEIMALIVDSKQFTLR